MQFWTTGAATSGGMWTIAHGTTGGTNVYNTITNLRQPGVFGGQLYMSTQAGTTRGIYSIGNGLPTTAGQTGTVLTGLGSASATPNGFVLLDLNNQVPGLDTAYIANDATVANGGGVEKWTKSGTTWSLQTTFKDGLPAQGINYVTAAQVGQSVVIVATSNETVSRVVRYIDDGNNMNPMITVLATEQPSTRFRGVAVSPQ
jgi:hypothetical protein